MDKNISRRSALKMFAAGVVATGVSSCNSTSSVIASPPAKTGTNPSRDKWHKTHDRVWLGGEYWANPMEDWRVVDGGAECLTRGGNRSIHSLTHQLTHLDQSFTMSVTLARLEKYQRDGGAGIRLGAKSELNEYRSNCFVQGGYDLGIKNNELILGNNTAPLTSKIDNQEVTLVLTGAPQSGAMALALTAKLASSGKVIGQLSHLVPASELSGNVALVSNFSIHSVSQEKVPEDKLGARYRFSNWTMQGEAFSVIEEQKFGPILWTMYTLSDSRNDEGFVMKLSAYTGPIGAQDNQQVELQVQRNNQWLSLGKQTINHDGWLATFRIANWNEKLDTPFRVIYVEKHTDGSETPDIYAGTIKANPASNKLRMAALTCQNDYGFPYEPVAQNVEKLNPDIVFFSGDQIYESHGGFGIVRTPDNLAILNYLRKFYQFGWSFKEVMRNQPTVCLPDDHDVLQGNLWGEGGATMQNIEKDPSAAILGGYIQSPRVVNMVHRTTLNHHPDPYDPTPTNGISSYYGDMLYGGVNFAIIADRQWKSGPERIDIEVGVTGQDEDKFSYNPKFNPDGLELLGKRQEDFLKKWGKDWRGHTLKAVLSQTVFAGICTHQPTPDRFMKYDFDSSGWPAKARDRAVDAMRDSMALHICGDTHLGSLSQYGVAKQRDSNWAFCTPAISAGWPRWWKPDSIDMPHQNRPVHGLADTGEFNDTFGNKMYIYAVGNPVVGKSGNRYVKAHEKGSGFGFITFDTEKRTYTMDAYKFLVDVADGNASNQYPGWPVTIHQQENKGDNILS
ncbi:alkaline phosphatase D family protein [Paraglaciecola aquimarina]|uniref:Alkaline phosphatase D family protein n=1 Tax=Paraglaciecola aquimarina TaxID=1235557 RepID=A0ABU3SYB5_9ALTE|nr:alkaline phosphatase D family protein [Paraglaciecola aquimarina]MDU0354999.1 alkaline phosphatase D family protein [Paraglaciecola aquimarina]